MKPDLKSMNRKALKKLSADIDKALARVTKKEMKEALAAAQKAAKAHGFSLAEIAPGDGPVDKPTRKTTKKKKNTGVPKYANPEDKTQTWTGKGRRPDWFLAAMEAGKSPEDLAV